MFYERKQVRSMNRSIVSDEDAKPQKALNLLLSKSPNKADLYSLLMGLDTDELLRVLTKASIFTKTAVQVRHELLRDVREQLSRRLNTRIDDRQGSELSIDAYIKGLQSINKRFKTVCKSEIPTDQAQKQVAILQVELVRIQSMPPMFEISQVSFSDVAKYASAISKQLSDWQLKCQDSAISKHNVVP